MSEGTSMSVSVSTSVQGQAEWWGLVVIVGAHRVVEQLGPRSGGVSRWSGLGVVGTYSLKTFSKLKKHLI